MTDKTEVGTATLPEFILYRQYVIGPLAPQDIVGATLKGQIRGWESATTKNATVAIALRLVKFDGSDYGTVKDLIGATPEAADATTTPPEFPGTTAAAIINRSLNNSAESATIALTTRYAAGGDFLVIEIGIRDNVNSTTATCSLNFGDNSATDLPEDNTTTAANNPWIEISQTLRFRDPLVLNNYQSVKAADGISVSELIR